MRRSRLSATVLVFSLMVCVTDRASAEVKLPAVIGDNMVLQRDAKVPIWGWAAPGEFVIVKIAGQMKSAPADNKGNWRIALDPLKVGKPLTMTVEGTNKLTLKNILVGEVWVCSGQSNMEMTVKNSNDADLEIAAANYPNIRLFAVQRTVADTPQPDCVGQWVECSPETIGSFSAVGYFFGRDVHKVLNVPVGMVKTAWGGTPSEAWTSQAALKADKFFKPLLDRWTETIANYDADKAKTQYAARLEAWKTKSEKWKADAKQARAEGKQPPAAPRRPRAPSDPGKSPHRPSNLFNGMVAPLVPYAIRGAIWYQGESNAGRAHQYRKLFPAMIVDWRKHWGQGDFPFGFVQLANFRTVKAEPAADDWAELREAQTMTLALPNAGMAVITDIGEAYDIHPKNKQDVGRRLARWALAGTYDKDLVSSGPMYDSMQVKGKSVHIKFNHVAARLMTLDRAPLKGFEIAGADKKFVWAEAKILGNDTVVVSSPQVEQPVAVRYSWAVNPIGTLYNSTRLPASPFRTDDWPGITVGKF